VPLVYTIYDRLIYAPKGTVPKSTRQELASGLYEQDEVQILPYILSPELPLVELGAGIGVVSCVANRLLKDPAAHLAVEMHPDALGVLEVNRAMNRARFELAEYALGYDDQPGPAAAAAGWDPGVRREPGRPARRGSLAGLLGDRGWDTFNLVMDIEGMELALLEHEHALVSERVVSVSVELHPHVLGVDGAARVVALLSAAGLALVAVGEGSVLGFRRDGDVAQR